MRKFIRISVFLLCLFLIYTFFHGDTFWILLFGYLCWLDLMSRFEENKETSDTIIYKIECLQRQTEQLKRQNDYTENAHY